jgi:phenylpropionate dioxygenase-like ring-hydroxylating dioxygenase large terminal subunit
VDQHTQTQLLQRAKQHTEADTTDSAPACTRFDARIYTDEQRLAAERVALFSRLPVVVGCSASLKQPGDYIANDWSGTPILVCRQPDGSLKAFLNVCRHRGTRLVQEKAGHIDKFLVCRYHAWSYDTSGRLRAVPCASYFNEVKKEDNGLCELRVVERAGLVFVVPERAELGSPDWEQYATELEGFGLANYEIYASKTVFGKLNWKMMIEANQESYHINFLHRDTAGPRFSAKVSLFDTLGPNTRTLLLHKQFSPQSLGPDSAAWRVLDHGDLVYFLFPNTLILLSTLAAHVLTAFPQGVDRSVVQGVTLVPPGTLERFPRPYYEKYWATILEDISVSEPIQQAAACSAVPELWLGANECLLAHFHAAVDRAIEVRGPAQSPAFLQQRNGSSLSRA